MTPDDERRDLVVFGTHPFRAGVPLGDWHIARALARRHRVLWVDPPASPLAPLRGAASSAMFAGRPHAAAGGVLVGAPVVPSGRPSPRLAGLVDRLVVAQTNRWIGALQMRDVDAISFAPRLGGLDGLRRRRLAAWLKDRDWAAAASPDPAWLRERAAELIRGADAVSAVSPTLVADCRALGVRAAHIPNGCDVVAFGTPSPEPAALRGVLRPRAVFTGAWNDRVDVELVRAVAQRSPGVSFVIVGPVSAGVPDLVNVHPVGPVTYSELPAHLQACDVGIVPYRCSPFNAASCPLKVYEYLAAGLPVVSAAVSVEGLPASVVVRRDDAAGFACAVGALAARDDGDVCRAVASRQSWDARATSLLALLDASSHVRKEVG